MQLSIELWWLTKDYPTSYVFPSSAAFSYEAQMADNPICVDR